MACIGRKVTKLLCNEKVCENKAFLVSFVREAEATVENYALESARRASLWSGGGDERIVIPR